ncbi:MAG: hypothetical protein D6715_05945 [Calditrichaeota bacterium]|nr:MAG: hypothetical protein D6715_05945 [Calditrichota bacterium]
MKHIVEYLFFNQWFTVFLIGLLLILSGIIIVLVPEILVALIAMVFMTSGIFLIGIAWKLRALEKRDQHIEIFIE